MFNVSNTDKIEILNLISLQFNRYFTILIFLFGTIGNFLNCLVLSRPCLRSNPCAFLFLISSIANIISITVGLTTRILSGWNMDLTTTNNFVCKCRAFVMFVSRTIAFCLIAFATIDRWFLSCSQYQRRQISSLRNAQRGAIVITIISTLLYCQVIYCYDANIKSAPLKCYAKTERCRILLDLTYALITILCPLLIMFIFGLMTISNIRRTHYFVSYQIKLIRIDNENKEILSLTSAQRQRRKRIDRYLWHVLFIQVIFLTILTMPQVIEKFYTTLTMHTKKSLLHITIDRFIYNFVLLLSFVASGMTFYIYTLSGGSIFRLTLRNLLQPIIEKLTCR
jgi:hypothetical protein